MTRKYTLGPEEVLRIAMKAQAPVLMLDVPMTYRIKRHIIYDPSGLPLAQFKEVQQALQNLAANEQGHFMIDCIEWERPMYATLSLNRKTAKWPK